MADITILVDPVIIVPPDGDATKDDVERWLEGLTIWLREALTAPFIWLHDRQTSALLEANEQFPNFQQLRLLQRKHRLDININQIAKYINDFFRDDTLDLAMHLKRLEYAIDPEMSSIIIKPDQFIARLPDYLHNGLYILLAECCACKHVEHPFGQNLHIATQVLPDSSRKIMISVVILDALPDFARPLDNRITQAIPLLITPDDLQPLADIIDLWNKGEGGITYAIKQRYKNQTGVIPNPDIFQLGPRFMESVSERRLDTNGIVLNSIVRAAADVIANKAKDRKGYKLHEFRQTEAADSSQLIREKDQAKAWRLMLQKHGAGWRLHYWQIPTHEGYIIEFANVCKESEREIY
jgi:hypothetical protein